MLELIQTALSDSKAEDVTVLDLSKKSDIADYMIVASGRADRHVGALAERVVEVLESVGYRNIRVEGREQCHWVVVDALDIIVHLFRPDVREYYNIEKLWAY